MANRKQIKASDLTGFNIYQDPKHGTILYDWLTKKGYQLTTSDVRWYNLSTAFLPVAVVVVYACMSLFKIDTFPSAIIGIIAYLVMKLLYRMQFLNKLPFVENYKRPNYSGIVKNAADKYSKLRLKILLFLAVALAGVSIAYLLISYKQLDNAMKFGMIVLALAAFVLLIFAIAALITKNKENK